MFARFDENPAMTLRVIKETKRYGRTDGRMHGRTDGRTHGQRENSIPPTNKVCGGYNDRNVKTINLNILYLPGYYQRTDLHMESLHPIQPPYHSLTLMVAQMCFWILLSAFYICSINSNALFRQHSCFSYYFHMLLAVYKGQI